MIKLSYDLHIHSCLSPCGDDDMTPSNIVGMSALKTLDIIAVTDHNSSKNCPAVCKLAEQYNIIALPGMELTTMEEVHVLCLFAELFDALRFNEYVSSQIMKIPNDASIFGKQEIYDENDNIIGTEPYLLINATNISFDDISRLMNEYRGVYIPAHIDKNSNSLLSNLGFIPPEADFPTAELADLQHLDAISRKNPYLMSCNIITNSDAHMLGNINEPEHFLECSERSREAVISAIRKRCP
ncbi:PHP domain-containing protein [Lachnospiraceae bacterium MD1]|jgi:PHP family Zn ribbon phosphoesterase|uniref:PHP domain-containing protein n=1 Tax=Variimorphobacter saccharofermentans TaxID=2755051 RepID=A0A839JUR1_9FIRM|nr:PHP domain-containing protein [Variimorphobacter saccharofermentans]MBB2181383.1 PHP domain-containing protein [Variimorphobacter saccharofermentans]